MFIACLTMLIDHIGFVFFPEMLELRLIGRLSMPIYAYCISKGYTHTQSRKGYAARVAAIALVSQIPFSLVVGQQKLNICFAWLIAIAALWCVDDLRKKLTIKLPVLGFLLIISEAVPMDYGITAVLWTILFYCCRKETKYRNLMAAVGGVLISLLRGVSIQLFSVFAVAVTGFCEKRNLNYIRDKRLKRVYHMFYPLHLILLLIIKVCHGDTV